MKNRGGITWIRQPDLYKLEFISNLANRSQKHYFVFPVHYNTFDYRQLDPSREIKKGSRYREFELSRGKIIYFELTGGSSYRESTVVISTELDR